MKYHYTEPYLINPTHRITVYLVGCGGTGTQVLSGLARMNEALIALGHPGIHVTVYDGDQVSQANVGRQLFSPADIGLNKAVVSVSRINRYFGYDWDACPRELTYGLISAEKDYHQPNILITCVDTAKARLDIVKIARKPRENNSEPYNWLFYWLDFGNTQNNGQVVLGTTAKIQQSGEGQPVLPTVNKLFNLRAVREKDQGPSCSLAEALNKQDLFVNSTLAQLGLNILWKLFREARISHHGAYLNLKTMNVNPIPVS